MNSEDVKCVDEGKRRKQHIISFYEECVSGGGRPLIKFDDFTQAYLLEQFFICTRKKHFHYCKSAPEAQDRLPDDSNYTLYTRAKKLGIRFKITKQKTRIHGVSYYCSIPVYKFTNHKNLPATGFYTFFTKETWCGQKHTLKYGWQESTIDSIAQTYNNFDRYRGHIKEIYEWRACSKTPSGSGQRIIILQIGNELFLPSVDVELYFIGKKETRFTYGGLKHS